MKTFVLCIMLLINGFLTSSGQTENEINDFITEWHNAAAAAEQEKFFNFIDEDGIYIGTDSTEVWTKQQFYDWSKPHFDKNKAWSFKATQRNIYLSEDGTLAWFDELIDYGSGTLRGSGVLQKRDREWTIMHYVLSVPVPNEKFKEVMNVIRENNPSGSE